MQTILETQGLSKQFGGVLAVDQVDFSLASGELLCILGPNGCGKTTLFNLITGHLKPNSGRVAFAGQDITGFPVHRISRLGIGRKFQVPSLFEELTVFDNLRAPYFARQKPRMLATPKTNAQVRQEIFEILERIHLTDKLSEKAVNLAHGQRQWLEIGMVLSSRPRLMLLDEPTAGMTDQETRQTAELIQRISSQTSLAIVVIEHDIAFVREVASRVIVMNKGGIFRQGPYRDIQEDPEVRDIYLGRRR